MRDYGGYQPRLMGGGMLPKPVAVVEYFTLVQFDGGAASAGFSEAYNRRNVRSYEKIGQARAFRTVLKKEQDRNPVGVIKYWRILRTWFDADSTPHAEWVDESF